MEVLCLKDMKKCMFKNPGGRLKSGITQSQLSEACALLGLMECVLSCVRQQRSLTALYFNSVKAALAEASSLMKGRCSTSLIAHYRIFFLLSLFPFKILGLTIKDLMIFKKSDQSCFSRNTPRFHIRGVRLYYCIQCDLINLIYNK